MAAAGAEGRGGGKDWLIKPLGNTNCKWHKFITYMHPKYFRDVIGVFASRYGPTTILICDNTVF